MPNGPAPPLGTPQAPVTVVPGAGWLQLAMQAVTTVGVPTVFAGVLLWFVLTRLGDTLAAIKQNEEDRVRIMAAMQDTIIAALDRQTDRFEKVMRENIDANRAIADRMERRGRAAGGGSD
ncbi:MAG TPA: hypothetical protein VKB54_20080 [Solirubrobacteraceae bacterium]|nr:hypothetical protein [Solirubrobacteraceae bacterium]